MLFGSLVDLQKIWDETFDNFLSVHIHLSLRRNICLDKAYAILFSGFEFCSKYLPFQYLSLEIRVATPRAEILTEALLCEEESSQEPEQQGDQGRCGTSHRQRLLRIPISVVRLGILS